MVNQLLGNYLVECNVLSEEQLREIKKEQAATRVKLGLIAIAENLLTPSQAEEINRLQAIEDKRFGDIAIEKNYLSEYQVTYLLNLQGNSYHKFIQAIVDKNFLTMDELTQYIANYQEFYNLTKSEMECLKSGDLDRILSVLIHSNSLIANELIQLAIRMIIRFIDRDVAIGKLLTKKSYSFDNLATQEVVGDHSILIGFGSKGQALLEIANPFAQEEFDTVDFDAFDAVCEFINCINGLFASKSSEQGVDLDMEPPRFHVNGTATADQIIIVPLVIRDQMIELIVSTDANISIK